MNIAICIKHVPVSNNIEVDSDTHTLIRASSEGMINLADLNALEEGLSLKEKTNGKVVVFTMGPPDAKKSLITALGMGCDEACHLSDRCYAKADTVATSKVLAEGIKKYGDFDLILTGSLTSDGATAQVGPMIAEHLSLPHVSEITQSEWSADSGKTLIVGRKQKNKHLRLRMTLPGLVTVGFGCNTPRFPTLRDMRKAKAKPLTLYTNVELNLAPETVGEAGSFTLVAESFKPEVIKKAEILGGGSKEIADKIRELVENEKGNH